MHCLKESIKMYLKEVEDIKKNVLIWCTVKAQVASLRNAP